MEEFGVVDIITTRIEVNVKKGDRNKQKSIE